MSQLGVDRYCCLDTDVCGDVGVTETGELCDREKFLSLQV